MKEANMLGPVYPPRHPTSTMSTTGSFAAKKAAHRQRNDSGELDVFEAARYFSSIPDIPSESGDGLTGCVGAGRRSLDLSMQHINPHHTYSYRLEKHHHPHHHHHHPKEKRSNKHKQPSSPGAKLASFLNSLFSQAYSKKNKSKSDGSGAQSARRDEEVSPNERRKRRSSISYFQTRSTKESQSMCSSSSSGFRTPPPSKVFRDASLPMCNVQQPKAVPVHSSREATDKKKDLGWGWMDGKFRLKEGYREIPSNDQRCLKKDGKEADDQTGWESDSSSDLFELKNYDLSLYSNSLPVYETTLVGPVK